jgi:hypothetical protein
MSRTTQPFFRFGFVLALAALSGACAAPGPVPATVQPALARFAEPYADGLRKAGVSSVMVYANGARVRVASVMGEVYLRYPGGLAPTAFALYVGTRDVEVDSDTFSAANSAQYEAAMKAILPEVIKQVTANNMLQMEMNLGGARGR